MSPEAQQAIQILVTTFGHGFAAALVIGSALILLGKQGRG